MYSPPTSTTTLAVARTDGSRVRIISASEKSGRSLFFEDGCYGWDERVLGLFTFGGIVNFTLACKLRETHRRGSCFSSQ